MVVFVVTDDQLLSHTLDALRITAKRLHGVACGHWLTCSVIYLIITHVG
jgi:hypothetical protein